MNTLRKEQIVQSGIVLNRTNIKDHVQALNIDILKKIGEEKINNYLEKKIKNFSIEDLNALQYKIEKFYGIIFDNKVSFYKNLFTTITNGVLLPDYIDNWKQEDIDKELDKILGNVINKVNIIISSNGFYGVNIGSEAAFLYEIDHLGALFERSFNIGGNFGTNQYYLNQENGIYESYFTVKLTNTEVIDDGDPTTVKIKKEKVVNYSTITKELGAYFGKSKNGEYFIKEGIHKGFYIKVSKITDSGRVYGDFVDDYCTVTIHNPELANDISPEDTKNLFISMLDLNNLVINFLGDVTNHKGGKRFHAFSSNSLLYSEDVSKITKEDKENDEKLEAKFKNFLVKMKNPVYFNEIGGQEEAKEELKLIIKTFKFEEIMKSWGTKNTSGIIFEGPSGTGKTLLAKALASEIDAEVYLIKLTDISKSALVNTSSNNISDLFKFLRLKAGVESKKIIVILDELDALFKSRNEINQSSEDTKVVNTFLSEMGGFEDLENIVFIGTTNNLEAIDKAVVRSGRMSLQIKIDLPNKKGIEEIYQIYLDKAKKGTERKILADDIDISKLISSSKGFSGADIEEVIRMVLQKKAIEEAEGAPKETLIIKTEDIISAINKIKSRGKKKTIKIGFLD
ncbi:ATP-binding protein [Candidatus Gracilibacteria bacterium]|nr:ATP-binding protein [Candidatus Gracilibacteria bacterium]